MGAPKRLEEKEDAGWKELQQRETKKQAEIAELEQQLADGPNNAELQAKLNTAQAALAAI